MKKFNRTNRHVDKIERVTVHGIDDLKKAIDAGYVLYYVDTEGIESDPNVDYIKAHGGIPVKSYDDFIAAMFGRSRFAKLREMYQQQNGYRVNI
jgi:hypothetical protein